MTETSREVRMKTTLKIKKCFGANNEIDESIMRLLMLFSTESQTKIKNNARVQIEFFIGTSFWICFIFPVMKKVVEFYFCYVIVTCCHVIKPQKENTTNPGKYKGDKFPGIGVKGVDHAHAEAPADRRH